VADRAVDFRRLLGQGRNVLRPESVIETGDAVKVPSIKPLLFLSLGLAAWIDFGSLHDLDNADAVIPVLMSLNKLTPFYWDQDRFGALVPLLAVPVKHPYWNLQLQWFLNAFAGVFSFVLGARYLFPTREWPLIALAGIGLYFGLTPLDFRFHYLGPEPYALGMTLGFGALLVTPPTASSAVRLLIATVLMLLAHWINIGLFLILLPVVLALATASRLTRARNGVGQYVIGIVIIIVGALGGFLMKLLFATQRTTLGFSSPNAWLWGWRSLLQGVLSGLSQFWLSLAVIAGAGLILTCAPRGRNERKARVLPPLLLVAASIFYSLLVGMSAWVEDNAYSSRYLHPAVLIVQAAVVALLIVPLSSYLGDRVLRKLSIAAAVIVLVAAGIGFGLPSASRVREQVARIDPVTLDVLSARCTHVAGEYWNVWPIVYRASLALFERGERRPIYGLAGRSAPTVDAAKAVPLEQMRIALLPTPDGEGERWLRTYDFPPLMEIERRSTLIVLEPVRSADRK